MEIVGIRILGVLLIALGLTVYLSPQVAYTTHEQLRKTPYRVRRDKAFLVPRPVAILIAAAGLATLILTGKTRPSR